MTLAWRTFSEAADDAGISRRYGGIHFEDGDRAGRALGRQLAILVWQKATALFDGVPQAPVAAVDSMPPHQLPRAVEQR